MSLRSRLALLLGLSLCVAVLGLAERWQRQRESSGRVRVVTDPPGLKYVLGGTIQEGRGWVEGRLPDPPMEGQRTLVCIGDSLTFGVSVPAPETWAGRVADGVGDPRLKLYNFGVVGYDAEQVATLLETRVPPFAPDILVWGAYVNDMVPTYMLYGADNGDPVFIGTSVPSSAAFLPEPLTLVLLQHSALFRRLQGSVFAKKVDPAQARTPYPGWYERQLDRIVGWAQARDLPLVVLAMAPHVLANPERCPSLVPDPGFCTVNLASYRYMLDQLRRRNVTTVDGLAALQASGKDSFFLPSSQDYDHPNAEGHALYAQALLPVFRAHLPSASAGGY
ncbi:MAG TPA: SGNH/GDSL hydrolase family protein [Myxococcota bacterium]|nr:SGNH/GDSL hydrolase family protein [Myxococcota bacterium]HND33504.1 SGNH/GDSL hydrolase family protein [Myxococcota bacterium]